MILNMNAGADPLNFRVEAGLTAPEHPGRNTIWVEAEGMTGWHLGAQAPEEPYEGLVWVQTGLYGGRSINCLKRNALILSPTLCRRYTGGTWTAAAAKIYQGQWLDLATELILYDGTLRVPLTLNRVTEGEGCLEVAIPTSGSGGAWIETEACLDLTPYSTLTADFSEMTGSAASSGSRALLEVCDSQGAQAAVSGNYRAASGTMTLDVSALAGMYQVRVQFHNASSSNSYSAKVTDIRLLM